MSSIRTNDMRPLAIAILGGQVPSQNATQTNESVTAPYEPTMTTTTQPRPNGNVDRRTSHYNSFQTRCLVSNDSPPAYATSQRAAQFPITPRPLDNGREVLPSYTCSVLKEGVMYMRIEKISPFQYLPKQQWRQVFVVLRGTQLGIYKVKTTTHIGSLPKNTAGKLIRNYTLQHAETGLANDVNDHMLIPNSRLAHLIPTMARRKAFEKDPDLFRSDRLYPIRLRVETDQLLLANRCEEAVFNWTSSICAAIDIAFPIDERCLPRQCTVPRRRRRQRTDQPIDNLQDQALVAEQERILREMYPTLARSIQENAATNDLSRMETVEEIPQPATGDLVLAATVTNMPATQEDEDIDLGAMAEDGANLEASVSRPVTSRQTTASTFATTTRSTDANPTENFDASGKWAPVHPRSANQQMRYTRRCMPILLFDAPRCSSVVICHGRRLHINNRMDMLEEWELLPPAYEAHNFETDVSSSSSSISNANVLDKTTTRVSSVDATSLAQLNNEMDVIQVVQTSNADIEAMGATLEKTKTGREVDAARQARPVSRHSKSEEHSPLQREFPVLVGF